MRTVIIEPGRSFAQKCPDLQLSDSLIVVKHDVEIERLFTEAVAASSANSSSAPEAYGKIAEYFDSMTTDPSLRARVRGEVELISQYVRDGAVYRPSVETVRDYVMSKCAFICAEIVQSRFGGILVDGTSVMRCYEDDSLTKADWTDSVKDLARICDKKGVNYVISAGYGHTPEGYRRSLGPKASDLMAMLLAVETSSPEVVVYSSGSNLPAIREMSYEEAAVFCSLDSVTLSPSSLLPVQKAGIPVRIVSIEDLSSECLVSDSRAVSGGPVTGYVLENGLSLVSVLGTGLVGSVGVSSAIFGALARSNVNIRFISQPSSEYCISLVISRKDLDKALKALEPSILDGHDSIVTREEVSIISVCGNRMRNVPGTSGKVFSALGSAGVNIIAAAQGGDELSISVVIASSDATKAENAIKSL